MRKKWFAFGCLSSILIVIIIIFVIYVSIASIIDSMQNHELALAKVRCENTQTMGLKQ